MAADRGFPDLPTIQAALEVACRAPSVHNTQPWRWVIGDRSVHLFADRSRTLPVIDRTGRELTISCGAALHHARVAFRASGWRPDVRRLPNPADADHLAAIELAPLPRIDQRMIGLTSASVDRRADRRPFLPDGIPAHLLNQLLGAAATEHAAVIALRDPAQRRETLTALAHADSVQRQNPMYEAELAEWSGVRLGSRHGVPVRNAPSVAQGGRGLVGRNFGPGELEMPPPLDDGATLFLISTEVDDAASWLHTGEALSALLLNATKNGLASCPLSQVAEVRTARDLVRHLVLSGRGEPQLVVRVGWPATAAYPGPATPRRPLDEVLSTWRDR